MKLKTQWWKIAAPMFLAWQVGMPAHGASQVLATVGSLQVTADDLNMAIASSPFSEKLPAMAEDDQAGLRGDMLRRLVVSRLLTLEARRLGLDKTESFKKDLSDFRLGLLYRAYMDKQRQGIVVPDETLAAMKAQYKQDRDALEAAKAAYINERYQSQKRTAMQALLKQEKVQLHEDRIVAGAKPDAVLADGTGIRVTYGELLEGKSSGTTPNADWVKDQLYRRVELLAAANAAARQGADVAARMSKYEGERLPAVMMEGKTKEWIPNEKALREWYDKHPDAATVPERRHIGQIVVGSQKEGEALRARIVKGESLFALAGQYSVDPVGKKQKGDMGWIVQGRGVPELEQALSKLKDGEASGVIKTSDGRFHILTILERSSAKKQDYSAMRERVAQNIVNEKLPPYVGELERRYGVTWNVVKKTAEAEAKAGK